MLEWFSNWSSSKQLVEDKSKEDAELIPQIDQNQFTNPIKANQEEIITSNNINNEKLLPQTISIPLTGFAIGFCTGFYNKSKKSGLAFMAENAHRRPNTVQGWYFYKKTKNYKVLLGGAKGGMKLGLQIGFFTYMFVLFEELIDKGRKRFVENSIKEENKQSNSYSLSPPPFSNLSTSSHNWINGLGAGLIVATLASKFYKLPNQATKKTFYYGILGGSFMGMGKDVRNLIEIEKSKRLIPSSSSSTTTATQ